MFLVVVSVTTVWPVALVAQAPPFVASGTRVRIRAPDRDSHRVAGTVVLATADSIVIARGPVDTLAFDLDSVYSVDMSMGRETFDAPGALRGAAAGLVIAGGLAAITDGEDDGQVDDPALVALAAGLGALGGAALGGGGWRARRGGLIGVAVGAPIGLLIAVATHDENAFFDSRGEDALAGAVMGGLGGGFLGLFVGAAIPRERWEPIISKAIDFAVLPDARGGMRVGMSLRF
jgi:hypothetical protein